MTVSLVSVILPTFNEAGNVGAAIRAIAGSLDGLTDYEILVVDDDSPDRTWEIVQGLGEADPRIRCERRIDRKGLSSAIMDGLRGAKGERLVVMDADLQHPADTLPSILDALENASIVVASRYMPGGEVGSWNAIRAWSSRLFTWWTRKMLGLKVRDPLSGFFGIRRDTFLRIEPRLNPRGYKALLELLVRAKDVPQSEVPLKFGLRHAGDSKLGIGTVWDLIRSVGELRSVKASK